MSKIALTPNPSGTGVFTIASPATNTDRTLTLPDEAGSIVVNTATGIDVTGTVVADNALFSGYIDFQTGGVNKGNIYSDASTMIINTQGTNTTLNTNGGNVGIGTSSPVSGQVGASLDTSGSLFVRGYLASHQTSKGVISFYSTDNTTQIRSYGSTAGSGKISFSTGGGGGSTDTEAMRIDSSGNLLVSKTSSNTSVEGVEAQVTGTLAACVSGGIVLVVNRNTNDGQVVAIRQGGTTEGSINVSGTTVSYNGGHLARWSQLADNTRDDTLLKGTVLTNLDQMASWLVDAVEATYYTEDDELPDGVSVGDEKTPAVAEHYQDNEQLNCMAVSSVEGDSNVAGVFVNWDNDDDIYTNDMNIAMTGDMIIRIAQGTTVARGDLLMSAGDGTAKPQGDDIVRSKTIAKVTSTHVTCTYDDGSYCVPCVLMAC